MKLWQKIFLVTLTLVIIVVNVSSMTLLFSNHGLTIERERQNALSRHNNISDALYYSVILTTLEERKLVLPNEELLAVIGEVLRQQQNDNNIGISLYKDKELVRSINQESSEAKVQLLSEPDYTSVISDLDGRTYLYIISTSILNEQNFQLITSIDITTTDELFKLDFERTRFVGIISALVVAALLLLLVRGLMSPLRNLSNTTYKIASGDLDKRATVKGHDEVAEVAKNFNIMADSIEKNVTNLEEIAESRRVFIGNLAHEMKTPLTSILGFADILRIKREVSDEDRIEYASVIVNETKRLQSLSGKLMELLTMGNLQITPEVVDVHDFVSELSTILHPIAKSHLMTLKTELPDEQVSIKMDKELMKSLVFNLVDNSIKASSPESTIRIVVESTDDSVKISVIDEGMGIPEDEIQYLTEPFYMLDKARTRKFGGAGLGLALCHEIALAHGSELKIQSEQGKGATVSIILKKEE